MQPIDKDVMTMTEQPLQPDPPDEPVTEPDVEGNPQGDPDEGETLH